MRRDQKNLKIVIKSDLSMKLKKKNRIVTLKKRMKDKQKRGKMQVKKSVPYVSLSLMTISIFVFHHQS